MTSLAYILAEISAFANPTEKFWEWKPCTRTGCDKQKHEYRITDGEQRDFCTTAGIEDGLGRWSVAGYYEEGTQRWEPYVHIGADTEILGLEGVRMLETITAALREHIVTCERFTQPLIRRTPPGEPVLADELALMGAELVGGN